jgi:hypothetical protein
MRSPLSYVAPTACNINGLGLPTPLNPPIDTQRVFPGSYPRTVSTFSREATAIWYMKRAADMRCLGREADALQYEKLAAERILNAKEPPAVDAANGSKT